MADVFSVETRSWIMSRIRSKHTTIDLKMKKFLNELHCGYKMYPKMYGNPDFVIKNKRIVIFCDGDFWHGYKYSEKNKPMKKYWKDKIEHNIKRDKKISRKLRRHGWSVLRIWEHDIHKNPDKCIGKIQKKIYERSRN